jgi:hypothetical protein
MHGQFAGQYDLREQLIRTRRPRLLVLTLRPRLFGLTRPSMPHHPWQLSRRAIRGTSTAIRSEISSDFERTVAAMHSPHVSGRGLTAARLLRGFAGAGG